MAKPPKPRPDARPIRAQVVPVAKRLAPHRRGAELRMRIMAKLALGLSVARIAQAEKPTAPQGPAGRLGRYARSQIHTYRLEIARSRFVLYSVSRPASRAVPAPFPHPPRKCFRGFCDAAPLPTATILV